MFLKNIYILFLIASSMSSQNNHTTESKYCRSSISILNTELRAAEPGKLYTSPVCVPHSVLDFEENVEIVCSERGDVVRKRIYKEDFQTEIVTEMALTSETNTHTLVHSIKLKVKSNPFFMRWRIDNVTLTAGETQNGIKAWRQQLTDDFTYKVTLSFIGPKEYLNQRYTLILESPKKTFMYSAPLLKHNCRNIKINTKSSNCSNDNHKLIDNNHSNNQSMNFSTNINTQSKINKSSPFVQFQNNQTVNSSFDQSINHTINEPVEKSKDFQMSSFFIGIGVGVTLSIILFFIMRLTICRPPTQKRRRLPTPPALDQEYYSELYSWRVPRR
ncbi:uncharacterized protein LOC128676974 isoform X2 [Plodia interpunctella]|uniref:uncharacterized protein LOC128676974 isoform X2 n=1 Tax=Plodia interpunctella TaxID=58824 RepID=UPI00236855D7|nr:uncharacterized protein LOC128676974 isoform X2 [Plodia interpunctella]